MKNNKKTLIASVIVVLLALVLSFAKGDISSLNQGQAFVSNWPGVERACVDKEIFLTSNWPGVERACIDKEILLTSNWPGVERF